MQGRTFSDAAWVVDEAENLDLDDLYITLTRQGENLSAALCGDIKQSRIRNSGLAEVVDMVDRYGIGDTGVIRFTAEDVVRSAQARAWVEAFESHRGLFAKAQYDNDAKPLNEVSFLQKVG